MNAERSVRPANPADCMELARVHILAFPDYFLSHLGPRFLRRYYRAFIGAGHTAVVAESGGTIVGFVVGTPDLASLRRALYRPNLLPFAGIVLGKCLTDQIVRSNVVARLVHIPLALKALFSRSDPAAGSSGPPGKSLSYLFSIAVEPEWAGSGVASQIMSAYVAIERARELDSIELSVFDDNPRALRFYEREGWVYDRREGSSLVYRLDLVAGTPPADRPTRE